jgi:hypothetical protein
MSGEMVKLQGWEAQPEPPVDEARRFHWRLLTEIIYGLYHRKTKKLAEWGFPPRPIHLSEIWQEYKSRRLMYKDVPTWMYSGKTYHKWPFPWYQKRTIDRRVNEIASRDKRLYSADENPKVLSTSAGYFIPAYARKDFSKEIEECDS